MTGFRCEICDRNMGDIDEPICHQCEVEEQDRIDAAAEETRNRRIASERARILAA